VRGYPRTSGFALANELADVAMKHLRRAQELAQVGMQVRNRRRV
jgi:hypothetical protein